MDLMDLDSCYFELCKANSGAIRFQVKSISGYARLYLSGINPPHHDLFDITLGEHSRIRSMESQNLENVSAETDFISLSGQFQEFWLTWYSESPIISKALQPKELRSGELRWASLVDHKLPPDALIGGFENEPLYIACALHERFMCPGKYVPSKGKAFVPWGGREHAKDTFQILCGYNATWVKTAANKIPQNAFIGGLSEVRGEPLYIGRAVHEGNLINGKIHVIYKTCYIPYQGKEVEKYDQYEILVLPDINYRGILGANEFDM